jgi:hypothetical protein
VKGAFEAAQKLDRERKRKESGLLQPTGKQNTETVLRLVREYAEKEDIDNIAVASTTGETGAKASKVLNGYNVVVITHFSGFKENGKSELQEDYKQEILNNKAKIFTGTHALSSAERAIRKDFGTIQP